jgi:preprotein translocase subunit SecD
MPKQLAIFLGFTASIAAILMASNGSWQVASDRSSTLNQPTQVPSTTELERSPFAVKGGTQLILQVKPTIDHPIVTKTDLEAVQKIIKNRLDGLGILAPMVEQQVGNRILVQLPGVQEDQYQVARVLGTKAQLEFREQKAGTEQQLSTAWKLLKELQRHKTDPKKIEQQQAEIAKLFGPAIITGGQIKNATAESGSNNNWEVIIEFDQSGAIAFTDLTKRLAGTGRVIGVFLDHDLISTPAVGTQYAANGITGGKAAIGSNFTAKTANDLVVQLRSGSLPLPVKIIENRTVPPK